MHVQQSTKEQSCCTHAHAVSFWPLSIYLWLILAAIYSTKERPFSCPTCFQTFSDPANVLHHRQRMHGYVKRYRRSPKTASTSLARTTDSSLLHNPHAPLDTLSYDQREYNSDEEGYTDGESSDGLSDFRSDGTTDRRGGKEVAGALKSRSSDTTARSATPPRRRSSFWEVVMDR